MKSNRLLSAAAVMLVLSGWGTSVFSQAIPASDLAAGGEIKGIIQCPSGKPVGGAVVYIAGDSFLVKTDKKGIFRLRSVPAGLYSLTIEFSGVAPKVIENVSVYKQAVTDLNLITVACEAPCMSTADCPTDQYCAKSLGACNAQGLCQTRPALCAQIYDPVCGCDGTTYPNDCEAAAAGVSIASKGACVPPSLACAENAQCAPDQYCAKSPGACNAQGLCQTRPALCTQVSDPVCGCDNKTYANDCDAAVAGVNVASKGACVPPPIACTENTQCPAEQYCVKTGGDCGGQGACGPRPSGCIEIYEPVCGCDGKTYSNACVAASAGANVASPGACATAPGSCSDNTRCAPKEYCDKAPGNCAGRGACKPRPELCLFVYDPVCGCDGKTYSNPCVAASAGVTVRHPGPCL